MSVKISAQELLRVTTKCLENIKEYNGEDDKDFLKLRNVKKIYVEVPLWTYDHCGIVTRLQELKGIAAAIKLSQTTYSELYKLLNKASNFQPYVFGRGY